MDTAISECFRWECRPESVKFSLRYYIYFSRRVCLIREAKHVSSNIIIMLMAIFQSMRSLGTPSAFYIYNTFLVTFMSICSVFRIVGTIQVPFRLLLFRPLGFYNFRSGKKIWIFVLRSAMLNIAFTLTFSSEVNANNEIFDFFLRCQI